jgi:hypothetical protein
LPFRVGKNQYRAPHFSFEGLKIIKGIVNEKDTLQRLEWGN